MKMRFWQVHEEVPSTGEAAQPQASNRNVLILSFVLVVVTLGFGLVIPIIPFYMESMGAGGTELGLLVASYAVVRLIFGPMWGSLSDRIGRKPVLMVGVLGYGITMVLFGLATQLWMLFAARILSGILSSATSPTTLAFISDSTPEKERGKGMGMLGAAIGVGTIFGPALGGLLAGGSIALPFFIAGAVSMAALGLVWLVLPESLPAAKRRKPEQAEAHGGGPALRELWKAFTLSSRSLGALFGVIFLAAFALTAFYGIFALYALERYNYGPQQVGLVLMVVGIVSSVAQGGLTGPLTKRWGEARVIQASLLGTAVGFAGIVVAGNFVQVLVVTGFFTLASALLSPAALALTSRKSELEQGITMGISNSFISLGRIFGPTLAGVLFDINPTTPFAAGAGVMLAGFAVSLRVFREGEKG
jgi:DHA1 family multidrug resistance protein-like MFS transporter